jgi:2'-5' RNA ligase
MIVSTRLQLSMFVPIDASATIERVRALLDPVQAALIRAHVTLCREDELAGVEWGLIAARLAARGATPLVLRFGAPAVFQEHGMLMPCVAGDAGLHALRQRVLGSEAVRHQAPHITLAHPRNRRSEGNRLENANDLAEGMEITFSRVHLIEQRDSSPWRVLASYALGDVPGLDPDHR